MCLVAATKEKSAQQSEMRNSVNTYCKCMRFSCQQRKQLDIQMHFLISIWVRLGNAWTNKKISSCCFQHVISEYILGFFFPAKKKFIFGWKFRMHIESYESLYSSVMSWCCEAVYEDIELKTRRKRDDFIIQKWEQNYFFSFHFFYTFLSRM